MKTKNILFIPLRFSISKLLFSEEIDRKQKFGKTSKFYRSIIKLFLILLLIIPIIGISQSGNDSTDNYYYITQIQDAYYDSLLQVKGADSMRGTGYKGYLRWKMFTGSRVDETGSLNTYMNTINNYYDNYATSKSANWTYYAPSGEPCDGSIANNGFGKGWVNEVLIDNSGSTDKIYAGTHNNGIWETENNGYDWNCITENTPKINGISSMCFNSVKTFMLLHMQIFQHTQMVFIKVITLVDNGSGLR